MLVLPNSIPILLPLNPNTLGENSRCFSISDPVALWPALGPGSIACSRPNRRTRWCPWRQARGNAAAMAANSEPQQWK